MVSAWSYNAEELTGGRVRIEKEFFSGPGKQFQDNNQGKRLMLKN